MGQSWSSTLGVLLIDCTYPQFNNKAPLKKKEFLEWIVYNWECSSAVITTFHLDTLIRSLPPPSFLTLPPLHTPAHISTYKYLYTYTNPRICDLSMWHVEIHALSADMSPFLKQTYLQLSIHPSIPAVTGCKKGYTLNRSPIHYWRTPSFITKFSFLSVFPSYIFIF